MKYQKLFIKTEDDAYVHCQSADGNDYTLCGLDASTGDSNAGIEAPIKTDAKINCPQCINIIQFCKKLKMSEMAH